MIFNWFKSSPSIVVDAQYSLKVNQGQENRLVEVIEIDSSRNNIVYRRLGWDEPVGRMRAKSFGDVYELVTEPVAV